MTRRVVTCRPDDDVHAVWQTMTAQALRTVRNSVWGRA